MCVCVCERDCVLVTDLTANVQQSQQDGENSRLTEAVTKKKKRKRNKMWTHFHADRGQRMPDYVSMNVNDVFVLWSLAGLNMSMNGQLQESK